MTVKKGDKIKVDYEGKFEDGTVFDSTERAGKPLEFVVGGGMLIKGFDEAVIGMKEGDSKEIKLTSDQAYGDHNPQLIQKVPKDKLPTDPEPEAGMIFLVGLPTGQQVPATIKEVKNEEVTMDMNHPLAGKNLNFKITVVEIVK